MMLLSRFSDTRVKHTSLAGPTRVQKSLRRRLDRFSTPQLQSGHYHAKEASSQGEADFRIESTSNIMDCVPLWFGQAVNRKVEKHT